MATNGVEDLVDSPPNSPKTVIKYEKSSCLFCNEWFDSQTFTEHLIHCGQVLEQCPNGCSVFVPRIRMRTHLKECPRLKQRRSSSTNGNDSVNGDGDRQSLHLSDLTEHRVQIMEQDISALRSVLNEEIRQRLHLITDVGNLRKQNQITDDWTRNTDETLNTLNRRLDEENAQRCFEVEHCQSDFRYCFDVVQTLKTELLNEVEDLRKHMNQLSINVTDHQNHLNDNIMKLEDMVVENEKKNLEKFIETEEFLQTLRPRAPSDVNGKHATMDLEIKSMKNIVCETEERCEKLEKVVGELDKKIQNTLLVLSDIESHLATQQRLQGLHNTRGHLLWRIKDYSKKLEEAKQYDTILHSAMFSNKPFGYALRLDLYLNGKGTWKGRNMLACLNVITGEYDSLLSWPCRLQADIIIRDQPSDVNEAMDYVKTIHARKKSDEYIQTNQFFFIPHKVIASRNYIKNDCIFVEIKILK